MNLRFGWFLRFRTSGARTRVSECGKRTLLAGESPGQRYFDFKADIMACSKKILVTGATGLVGNNVVRRLLQQSQQVRVLVRQGSNSQPLEGLDVEVHMGDVQDPNFVMAACQGIDAVVHAAGIVRIGWSMGGNMREINVDGTHHVLAASLENHCRMVHVSTVNALAVRDEFNPSNEDTPQSGDEIPCNYVTTKRAADRLVWTAIRNGLDATIVYPGMMLGPFDWKPSSGQMLLAVARQFTPVAPGGGISVSDVRDVAKSICEIVLREQPPPHRDYILAGHNLSYFDLWKQMATVANSRPPVARMGRPLQSCLCIASDVINRMLRTEPIINSAAIRMGQQFHYYDSSRAIGELGYAVSDLLPTLEEAWDWLRKQH